MTPGVPGIASSVPCSSEFRFLPYLFILSDFVCSSNADLWYKSVPTDIPFAVDGMQVKV